MGDGVNGGIGGHVVFLVGRGRWKEHDHVQIQDQKMGVKFVHLMIKEVCLNAIHTIVQYTGSTLNGLHGILHHALCRAGEGSKHAREAVRILSLRMGDKIVNPVLDLIQLRGLAKITRVQLMGFGVCGRVGIHVRKHVIMVWRRETSNDSANVIILHPQIMGRGARGR